VEAGLFEGLETAKRTGGWEEFVQTVDSLLGEVTPAEGPEAIEMSVLLLEQ
jgi:hypothetical protein